MQNLLGHTVLLTLAQIFSFKSDEFTFSEFTTYHTKDISVELQDTSTTVNDRK